MVTAGHLAYDHKTKRRAVSLNTYAGYHGRSSIKKDVVQKRQGKRVVILEAYYQDRNQTCDVALVKLQEPFENAQPFTPYDTPEQGNSSLAVVGYPGDKDKKGDDEDVGPFMYGESAMTQWDLHTSECHLLQYPISTFSSK